MTNSMTRDDLLQMHDQVGKLAREVMTAKNHDYAHDNDVFRNFRRYGTLGVLVRLSDKLARLDSFEENKEFKVANEKLEDTIVDIINYAVIYLAMKQESPKAEVKDGPYCDRCEQLADFSGGSLVSMPQNICSNCAAECNVDTTNWYALGRL